MKVILSRKGFDSKNTGCPSPILPDGTLLSMPIPGEEKDGLRYDEITYDGHTYGQIWKWLSPRRSAADAFCHLDPDIRADVRIDPVEGWKPAFGQISSAQTQLSNQKVTIGDLFLYFGWFREAELIDSRLQFKYSSPELHIIYGYMQIGGILKGDAIGEYPWHPHSGYAEKSTLYIPTEKLTVNGQETELPGCGTLKFREDRVLTAPGMSRTKWKLLDWMKDTEISYHKAASLHEDHFRSVSRGQEFVIQDNEAVVEWALRLIDAI